jgi:hypothetical protein
MYSSPDFDLLQDAADRLTSPERANTFLKTLSEICGQLQKKPELLSKEYCHLLQVVSRILAIAPDEVDNKTIKELESEFNRCVKVTRYLCEELIPLAANPSTWASPYWGRRQIMNILRQLSIPHRWDNSTGYIQDAQLWVPFWVNRAVQAYYANGGYAGLDLRRYLSKMRPEPEEDEKETSKPPVRESTKTAFKRKERRPHRRQPPPGGYHSH